MLWDIIRDFIVEHITGGVSSNGDVFSGTIGSLMWSRSGAYVDDGLVTTSSAWLFNIGSDGDGLTYYIGLGDWLATTLTIIAMCLIVAFAIWLVRWVFKAVSSAFLLRR